MTESPNEARRVPATEHFLPGAVVAATLLVFAGTIGFDFVNDDRLQVLQNPYILAWRYLPRYFSASVWSFRTGIVSNYYRPLFFVWLRLNDAMFGLRPAGWHFTSMLLHALVALQVYWLGRRLIGESRPAVVAAAIFGLHPIHAETVAWVSASPDLLVTALMLGSLLTYLRFREGSPGKILWFSASLVLFGMAAFTKEFALVFPLIVFAYEWIWRRAPQSPHPWLERRERLLASLLRASPYLVLSLVYLFLRIRALGTFSMVMANVPLRTTILTWPSLLWFYARKLVWPSGLSPFYDNPYVTKPGFGNFVVPALATALIVALLWFWARRTGKDNRSAESRRESRLVAFAAVWMGLPFLTLLNLSAFQAGEIAKDRYLYIPSIGAAWLAGLGWRRLAASGRDHGRMAAGVALAACLLLGALTMRQTAYWSNDLLLYTRACEIAPHNAFALGNMAITAYSAGYPQAALKLYQRAVEADPTFERVYYNMAVTELALGRVEDSDRDLMRALKLEPADPSALFALGKVRDQEGQRNDAARFMRQALELEPHAKGYHLALGSVLEELGDLSGAVHEFTLELSLDPGDQEARAGILRVEKRVDAQLQKN